MSSLLLGGKNCFNSLPCQLLYCILNRLICTLFFNSSWCKSAYSSNGPSAKQLQRGKELKQCCYPRRSDDLKPSLLYKTVFYSMLSPISDFCNAQFIVVPCDTNEMHNGVRKKKLIMHFAYIRWVSCGRVSLLGRRTTTPPYTRPVGPETRWNDVTSSSRRSKNIDMC